MNTVASCARTWRWQTLPNEAFVFWFSFLVKNKDRGNPLIHFSKIIGRIRYFGEKIEEMRSGDKTCVLKYDPETKKKSGSIQCESPESSKRNANVKIEDAY